MLRRVILRGGLVHDLSGLTSGQDYDVIGYGSGVLQPFAQKTKKYIFIRTEKDKKNHLIHNEETLIDTDLMEELIKEGCVRKVLKRIRPSFKTKLNVYKNSYNSVMTELASDLCKYVILAYKNRDFEESQETIKWLYLQLEALQITREEFSKFVQEAKDRLIRRGIADDKILSKKFTYV